MRRIDIIIAPAEECAFCVLGWTGSRQYLRFLRQHAVDLGMALNSHRQVPPADEPQGTTYFLRAGLDDRTQVLMLSAADLQWEAGNYYR